MTALSLIIPLASWQKIMGYTKACETEITGFADVAFDPELTAFVVGEVYLLEQAGSSAEVEMSGETIADFTYKCIQEGMTQLPRLWWHSHVEMKAFFSTTDRQAMEDLTNDSYSIALVVNKMGELSCTLNLYQPFPHVIDNIPVRIDYAAGEIPEAIRQEVLEKVKKPAQKILLPQYGYPWEEDDDGRYAPPLIMQFDDRSMREIKMLIQGLRLEPLLDDGEIMWVNTNTGTIWQDTNHVLDDAYEEDWYLEATASLYDQEVLIPEQRKEKNGRSKKYKHTP